MKVTITIELTDPTMPQLQEWLGRIGAPVAHVRESPARVDLHVPAPAAVEDTRPWKPVPELLETNGSEPEELTKICRKCHADFTTTSRVRVLCNQCFFETEALRPEKVKRIARGRPGVLAILDRSAARFIMEGVKHGTAHSYKKGCRCWPCTDAKAAERSKYEQARKARANA